ncbi:MAG: hypothetical protein NZ805_08765 [Armatimonadetes bacterium]|nr:hypothetical protein [Armatimonadota bacterium]MDW8028198.1 hypothetical protein [Armatimonadota bacterium]
MEIRLGDLYDLIVRIVDDHLKQQRETDQMAFSEVGRNYNQDVRLKPSESSEGNDFQAIKEQVAKLMAFHRHLLDVIQTNQKRTEALLNELLNLLRQQSNETSMTVDRRINLPSINSESENGLNDKGATKNRPSENRIAKPIDAAPERKSSPSNYAVMSPPEEFDSEISTATSDIWLTENLPQPVSSELATDGVSETFFEPIESKEATTLQVLMDQLSDYLKRFFSIDVDYLHARHTPSSPSLQDGQILVGEGFHKGQPVTITIFGKSQINPADVTVFYNAIVRPLRSSVTEPVISVVFGETFEPKALKVAYALDLLVINLKDLQNMDETAKL